MGGEIAVNSGSASAHYSLFDPAESQGVINGTENISVDPLFVDQDGLDGILGTSDDDFQLQASSPAINIGSNGFTDYPSHDILGKVDRVSRFGSLRVLGQLSTRDHLRKHGKSFRKPNRYYQGIGSR